jgi:ABC-2 type transport system permease protein
MKFFSMVAANMKMTVRNKQALFFLFVFPLLFMGLFGIVLGGGQGSATIAVVVQDKTPAVNRIADALDSLKKGSSFKVKILAKKDAIQELKSSKLDAVIVLRDGSMKNRLQGNSQPGIKAKDDWNSKAQKPQKDVSASIATAEVYYDPASMQSQMMQGTVASIISKIERSMVDVPPRISLKTTSVQAKHSSYIDFLLPGILAMSLMNSGLYGISASTVARREKGVLRRLKLTPMPLAQFIGAGIVNQLIVSFMQSAILIMVGYFAFGVRINGSFLLTGLLVLVGSVCFITLGFTIASFAKTVDAANAIGNVIGMPMMFLGGVFFSVDNAPSWIQPLIKVMPLKYLADALRSVMINGSSLISVQNSILILLAVTAVLFAVSVKFFKWESDRR